jgi:hypothetical protein
MPGGEGAAGHASSPIFCVHCRCVRFIEESKREIVVYRRHGCTWQNKVGQRRRANCTTIKKETGCAYQM